MALDEVPYAERRKKDGDQLKSVQALLVERRIDLSFLGFGRRRRLAGCTAATSSGA
jgi:hypothetical protein